MKYFVQIVTGSLNEHQKMWVASREDVSSGICGQRRPRSAWVSGQSNQGLHCPLKESLDTEKCKNEEPGRYFAHVQDGLNLRMSEDLFSLDNARVTSVTSLA